MVFLRNVLKWSIISDVPRAAVCRVGEPCDPRQGASVGGITADQPLGGNAKAAGRGKVKSPQGGGVCLDPSDADGLALGSEGTEPTSWGQQGEASTPTDMAVYRCDPLPVRRMPRPRVTASVRWITCPLVPSGAPRGDRIPGGSLGIGGRIAAGGEGLPNYCNFG
jgi:hypothetical protein